ncbi:MAG: protein TolQ [Deltaproteobacteria bacterium]|nr:protein TolQ [Deltaproteobacteria bacterium]
MEHVIFANLIDFQPAVAPHGVVELDPFSLIWNASFVVKMVILLLVLFSLACWYIITYKLIYLQSAQSESEKFLETFWQSKRLDAIYQTCEQLRLSPLSQVFKAGYIELTKLKGAAEGESMSAQLGGIENVERALRKASAGEVTKLEKMVQFLATTGSTAPFVGLFGTVWGIMNSFIGIGSQRQASLAVVAPGIAEALIATAIGLVAAIPAVIAYNFFLRRIRVLSTEMDAFSNDFLNIVKRHFFK